MFKNMGSIANHASGRANRFGEPPEAVGRPAFTSLDPGTLISELASLRASIDHLAATFQDRFRGDVDVIERTEQISAAIQRLEWALARRQSRTMCAGTGA